MIKLFRELLVIAMLVVMASTTAFAQKKDHDNKRPKKEPVKVITNDRKDNNRPKQNDKQRPKPDKRRGRP